MNLVEQMMDLATRKHILEPERPQMYGILPYTHHLQAVAAVLAEFGLDDDVMQAAAWGHDIIEDTDAKRRDIQERFGDEVADLVWAVTSEDGDNRKTRNAATYPKIRDGGPRAVCLKLADRIANVRNGGGSVQMYKREHEDFRRGIYLFLSPDTVISEDDIRMDQLLMQEHLDRLIAGA